MLAMPNMKDTPMTLGERLKATRESRGLTLRELERLSGVSNATISQIETGRNPNPTAITISRLAKALGVEVTYLLGPGPTDVATPVAADADFPWPEGFRALRHASKKLTERDKKMLLSVIEWAAEKSEGQKNAEEPNVERLAAHMEDEYGESDPEMAAFIARIVKDAIREYREAHEEKGR